MNQQDQVDLFYLGEDTTPVGTLTTRTSAGGFTTSINFSLPDGGTVTGELSMQSNGSVREWTTFRFVGDGKTIDGERTAKGVRMHGSELPVSGDVIPGYACSSLVVEFASSTEDSLSFTWLQETGDDPLKAATLVRAGTEEVDSPVRGVVENCVKVELSIEGTRTNTYWVKGPVVVASDWAGACSYALPEPVARSLAQTQR